MGGIFSSDEPDMPVLKKAPEPYKFAEFRDLLNNVEVKQEPGAGGKDIFIQKEINVDPVFENFIKQAKQRIGGLINEISAVARENPRLVAPFQGFINEVSQLNDADLADWTNTVRPEDFTALKENLIRTNTFLNNESWDNYDHQLEIDLTARGLSNSTVGNEKRALAMRSRQITNDQIRNNAELTADQLVNTDLARKEEMFKGRSATRNRAADIAGQQYGLQQEEVNRNLLGRDDRMNKLMQVLGLNQNSVNEDVNRKRGANIAPTVLGAQDAITGRQQSAWAQENQNELTKYNIASQKAASDNALTGSLFSGGLALAGGIATGGASLFPSLSGGGQSTWLLNNARKGLTRN